MVTTEPELTSRLSPPKRMTFEEFLAWPFEYIMAEWIDGEVIVMSPASLRHQEIGSLLEAMLRVYVEVHNLGMLLLRAPFVMRLAEKPSGREPDLLFVRSERTDLIRNTYVDGPADVAVEIASPESIGRDRGDKFVEYERAQVKEYRLIDPERESAEFYQLGDDGRYRAAAIGADGVYHSKVIVGFGLRVEWLWQTPLPQTLDVLRQLKLI